MAKLVGNIVIMIAGSIMLVGAVVGIAVILAGAAAVVMFRRLRGIKGPDSSPPLLQD